ncbi:MAG: hypothetical protein SX243_09895 [Acidobacteriota bacterium]|nr:hypothetical protein [Acidobacteriota bacterium]
MSSLSETRWQALLWLGLFLAGLLLAAWAHRATLTEPYVVNNDSHQHIYWMQQWEHPERFQDDLLTVYARDYQPWGFRALYRVASVVVDPLTLSRWLPLFLFALSVLLVGRLAARFAGVPGALLAATLFAFSPFFLQKMAGAHPRAFAVPILLLTLDLLVARRHRWLAWLLPAAALLYPMAFLLAGGTAALAGLFEGWQGGTGSPEDRRFRKSLSGLMSQRKMWMPILVGLLLGGGVLVAKYTLTQEPRIGPLISGEEMRQSPEFYAGGRQTHLPTPGPYGVLEESLRRSLPNLRQLLPGNPPRRMPRVELWGILALLALALGLAVRRRHQEQQRHPLRLPPALLALFLASYGLYAAAEVLLFRLFLPRRYVMYSLPLLAILALAALGAWFLARLPRRAGPWALAAALAGLLLTAPALDGVGLDDYSRSGELYAYLQTLPEDTLIAPFPTLGDGIPLFTGRRVVISYELSNPYFTTYWRSMTERLEDFFDAYYAAAPDLEPAADFCRKYGVDLLVIDRRAYRNEVITHRRGAYFAPFSQRIRARAEGVESFALEQLALEAAEFRDGSGEILVVACEVVEARAR